MPYSNPTNGNQEFIVEWRDGRSNQVTAIHKLDDWLRRDTSRATPLPYTALVYGVDELDVYMRAMRGEYD